MISKNVSYNLNIRKFFSFVFLTGFFIISLFPINNAYACMEDPGVDIIFAVVNSPTVSSVTQTTATLGGNVASNGSYFNGCVMASFNVSPRSVMYGTSPGSYPYSATLVGNTTGVFTIPVTGLTPGTTYYFRPNAGGTENPGGESSFTTLSPPDTTAPSTPGAMTTSWSGDHYVNTSFTAATTGSTDNVGVSYYNLCRSNDNAGGCASWVATGIGTSYTVSGADLPSPGTFRYYSWYAYDAAGNQSGTTQEYVRMDGTAPPAPGVMTTSWTGDHYVTTNFTAATTGSTDAGIGTSYYNLCRSNDNAGGCSVWVATGIGASTVVSGSHLPSAGTYRYYYWYAYDAFGNQSSNSTAEYVRMNAQIPVSTPTFPSNGGTVSTAGSITFTTNAVSDGDGQTPQYYFRVATGSDGETGQVCNSGWQTSTSYVCDPGIGTFYWHVYTYDGINTTGPNYTWSFNKVLATQSALSISSSVTATFPSAVATLTSSGGSGSGAVTYALTSAGTAGCSVSGTTVSYTNAGTCTVTATKAADSSYNAISSSATTFTINQASQSTLTTTAQTVTYPAAFSNAATTGGSGTGAVTYALTSAGTAGCSVTSGGVISYANAGTCTITATKAADTNYTSVSSAAQTFTVSKASQSSLINVGASTTAWPATLGLTITGGSGTGALAYSISSAGTAGCSVGASSGIVTPTTAGTCDIAITRAADTNYNISSTLTPTVTFAQASQSTLTTTAQTVTYPAAFSNAATTGGSGTGAVTYALTSAGTAGCSVTSGGVISYANAGTCTITATKAADTSYNATSSSAATFTISKGDQSLLSVTNATGTFPTGFTLGSSGGSGSGAVTYTLVAAGTAVCAVTSGGVVSFTYAGTCTVNATKAADSNYNATTSVTTTVTINSATTLGNGTDPSNSTTAGGGSATEVNSFTFQTSTTTDVISAVSVEITNASSTSLLEVTNNAGTVVYGSTTNPTGSSVAITLNNSTLTATSGLTQYKIRITPKTQANLPIGDSGQNYTVTANIASFTSTNVQAGSDSAGTTITIDNLVASSTSNFVSPANTQATIYYTLPSDSDLASVVILGSTTSAVTQVPVDGTAYSVGNTISGSTVLCVDSSISPSTDDSCTATSLLNGTTYYFKVFTKDSNGNYSSGATASGTPVTPNVNATQVTVNSYRFINDDNSESSASSNSSENSTISSSYVTGDKTRLRFVVSNTAASLNVKKYQIEYSSGACSTWTAIPRVSDVTNQDFRMDTSSYVSDSSLTTHRADMTVPGGKTFVPGRMMTFSSTTPNIVLNTDQYTELEYVLRSMSNITPNVAYCFRLTDNGDPSGFIYSVSPILNVYGRIYRYQGGGGGGYNTTTAEIEAPSATAGPAVGGGSHNSGGTATSTETNAPPAPPQATTTPTRPRGGSEDVGLLQKNDTFASGNTVGIVLGATSDSMCVDLKHRMLYGESDTTTGGEVSQVQYYLKLRGYFNGKVTGLYLDRTKEAIKQFQKDNDLIVTGIAGKVTRAKMAELGCQVATK